ncbi:MAG: ribonuclease J [Chloroflexi bacterium]|nr:ribonuclease J [Chloroflexota bacterium]
MANKLRIIPIGGLGEVGKNMMVFEYGRNALIVDTGLMFPENDMLGIDYIIPDYSYLRDKADIIRGIIITHGHEDHTGAIKHVIEELNAPIYATPLTRGLLEVKLRDAKLLDKATLNTVQAGDTVTIGPFTVEFFHVCHSIPDCVGLGITTPVGLVVHSGDYKIDHTPVDGWVTDFSKLGEFASRGVLALLSDSTNAAKPGWTPSEAVIDGALDKVLRDAPGRVIIATFASLISRIQQVVNACVRNDRKMTLVGTSMVENAKMAQKLGYLEAPDGLLISMDQALNMADDKVVIMTTGSQGEPSSILGRLSVGRNRQFDLKEGDTVVISAHPIPGNEEMVSRTINRLFQRGANVIYDPILPVHVSGHASSEEQKLFINLVRPKFFVPIHGELRQLHQHAALAREVGIPDENIAVIENGTVVEFAEDAMNIGERVPGGYVYVDGTGVGDIGPEVMRERENLARDGFVVVNLLVDRKTRKLVEKPLILSKGFVFVRDSEELFSMAAKKAEVAAFNANGAGMARSVEERLSEFFYSEMKRRPMVFAIVNEV